MNPLISVIIPIYNSEKYLDKCIKSVLNQTYKNLEIILINDGSLDNSSMMCEEYATLDYRVKVIHKKNGGVCSARNIGLDVCKGDYIGFIDSDDWISPSMYEDLLYACKDKKTIGTIGTNQVGEDGVITVKRVFSDKDVTTEDFLRNVLCRFDGFSVWSRLFPRSVIGNSRFNEGRLNEEVLFWKSIMSRVNGVSYSSSIGYYYLQRSESLSHIFGKSIYDMVENATELRMYVEKEFPTLYKEAQHFEISQYMNFLLCCPFEHDRKNDPIYGKVVSYIVKNRKEGIKDPFFSYKDKLKLLGVSFCPKIMSMLIELKNRY